MIGYIIAAVCVKAIPSDKTTANFQPHFFCRGGIKQVNFITEFGMKCPPRWGQILIIMKGHHHSLNTAFEVLRDGTGGRKTVE